MEHPAARGEIDRRQLALQIWAANAPTPPQFTDLGCPAGGTMNPGEIRAIWLFLNGGQVFVDNVRAESSRRATDGT